MMEGYLKTNSSIFMFVYLLMWRICILKSNWFINFYCALHIRLFIVYIVVFIIGKLKNSKDWVINLSRNYSVKVTCRDSYST